MLFDYLGLMLQVPFYVFFLGGGGGVVGSLGGEGGGVGSLGGEGLEVLAVRCDSATFVKTSQHPPPSPPRKEF